MHLHPEEPEASSWEPLDDVELAVRVRALLPAENHALVLVDGRSGSGKSTFAERLARLIDQDVRPVDRIVVPSDVVGVHHCAGEEACQALGEGRLPAARPAVHEDQCVVLCGEQRTHADG